MRVRTAATATALAAAAALTLTACGGGSGSGDDKISAAPSTSAATPAPSTAPSGNGTALKIDPALALPADLKAQFSWTAPKNADEAAALSGAANFIQAIDHAVVQQNKSDPGLIGYAADDALAYAQNYVQQNVDQKLTMTGTDRYYGPTFTLGSGGGSVEVKLCNDQSKLYSKEVVGGKVHVTGASDRNYVSWDIVMVKLPTAQAVWQAHAVTVKEKALQCKQ
ncbi:hypothetical protein RVR_6774 [Actinacidiphila reveromycinica]|uniref:Lipoprotein n=1 Tax=Actinacidiphila reveromycinica TaxID=659352 RepID=A0A7U3VQL9_9ACTN|nr:hypothetical protein [Streptomyces sp. SN-593]BBA99935.1 hypothetical protein RVR_6774 [Streptomyces sp. SN-593]